MDTDPTPNQLSRRDFLLFFGSVAGGGFFSWLISACGGKVSDQPQNKPIVGPYTTATPPSGDALDYSKINAEKPTATPEQVEFLRKNQQEPVEMILKKLRGQVNVVGLGEMHNELDMELFAVQVMEKAAEQNLVQFLALEIDTVKQNDINHFLETGNITPGLQEVLNQHNTGYRTILETARSNKLKVLCVDNHDTGSRDDFMSKTILQYQSANPDSKGLFYAGNGHIIERFDILAGMLGNKYYSVSQINEKDILTRDTVYNAYIQSGINIPIGIDDIPRTPFSKATYGHPYELWSEYGRITDAIVLLPKK